MQEAANKTILVLGGYGHFGARIVRGLAASPGIEVIAAGRHPHKAAAMARIWPGSCGPAAPVC